MTPALWAGKKEMFGVMAGGIAADHNPKPLI
jgi:hypothetical protein